MEVGLLFGRCWVQIKSCKQLDQTLIHGILGKSTWIELGATVLIGDRSKSGPPFGPRSRARRFFSSGRGGPLQTKRWTVILDGDIKRTMNTAKTLFNL